LGCEVLAAYLGEVEEDLDGGADDIHAGETAVAAADEGEEDQRGATQHQTLAAFRGQASSRLCTNAHIMMKRQDRLQHITEFDNVC